MKYKKWTAEEDNMIIQAVKDNFDNLQKGFSEVAEKTNRSLASVSSRWYNKLSNPLSKKYVGSICFVGLGNRKYHYNRKIITEKNKQNLKEISSSYWSRILEFLGIKITKV